MSRVQIPSVTLRRKATKTPSAETRFTAYPWRECRWAKSFRTMELWNGSTVPHKEPAPWSARRKPTPSYLLHRQSGRERRAVWTDATGIRQQKLLPGPFDSPESLALHLLGFSWEIAASPMQSPNANREGVSINELLLAFLQTRRTALPAARRNHHQRVSRVQTDRPPRPRTVRPTPRQRLPVHLP